MKKIVFLPCHPNMWEGFQTIYEKEILDTDTKVTVIPVPTYQRGENNSLYDAEYITTGYPPEVNICGINDYNLSKEHPDTIYIQNVYDTDNPVFAIHPYFHTTNLRLCTNNLIYIPYSCMSELEIDYNYLKNYYSKILTPSGIQNVNKIILHSENAKEVYLTLLAGYDDTLRHEWIQKISCKNYPRIDILKKYSKETVPYPNAWNKYLFDSDGQRKKAILFSTSVMGVIEFNRSHLRKTRSILEEYAKQKSIITLIWRPHHFLPEIIKKLRPELFDDFKSLLEFYISNGVGILDETPTPTPAIILSDAYIGDNCGVKELFSSTGKPILDILNPT